jgi:hypothetical protein
MDTQCSACAREWKQLRTSLVWIMSMGSGPLYVGPHWAGDQPCRAGDFQHRDQRDPTRGCSLQRGKRLIRRGVFGQTILRPPDLSVTNFARASEDIAWLEDVCAGRRVGAVEADLAASDLPAGERAKAEGMHETEGRLRGPLRLVQLESHLLRGWRRAASPELLAQRMQYQATMLGMHEIRE